MSRTPWSVGIAHSSAAEGIRVAGHFDHPTNDEVMNLLHLCDSELNAMLKAKMVRSWASFNVA